MRFFGPVACAVGALVALVSAGPIPRPDSVDAFVNRELGLQQHNGAWADMQVQRSPEEADISKRIVYNPRFLTPAGGEVWTAGSQYRTTWISNDIPPEITNVTGMLKLGYTLPDGSGGLNEKWTLAKDFPLSNGFVDFVLPTVLEQRSTYFLVLFGDSGNISKYITIVTAADGQATGNDNGAQQKPPYAVEDPDKQGGDSSAPPVVPAEQETPSNAETAPGDQAPAAAEEDTQSEATQPAAP